MSVAVLRPGDTLLLVANAEMSTDEVDRLRDRAAEQLPNVPIVVLNGMQAVVVRGGRDAATQEDA